MINLIQSPSTSYAYSGLLTHGDGEGAHGRWRWRWWRWRWRRPPDPSSGGEILDQSVSEIEDRGGGGGVFRENSPPLRAPTFSYIWGGTRKAEGEAAPEAPVRWAHVAQGSGRVGPTLLGLVRLLESVFCTMSFFSIKNDVVFFPDLFFCKNNQKRDFAKNSVRFSSFIQIWEDSGANYEAKCLEK